MNKAKILKTVKEIVRNYLPSDYKVMVFGSWAKGNALKSSDFDIAILGKKKVPWESMVKISQEVENLPTLRSIDIVDLNAVEKNFKDKALEHTQIL